MGHTDSINELGEFAGSINPYELVFKLSYTHSFNKSISTGLAMKYLNSKVEENFRAVKEINSFAIDIGFNYDKRYNLKQ